MNEVSCQRCGASWLNPTTLDPELSREIALLIQSNNPILAIRRLRDSTGLELRDAKAVILHLTRESGKCHRCGSLLATSGMVTCPQCRCVNYDW